MFVTVTVMNWELSAISMLTLIMSLSPSPEKCLSEAAGPSLLLNPAIPTSLGFCRASGKLLAPGAGLGGKGSRDGSEQPHCRDTPGDRQGWDAQAPGSFIPADFPPSPSALLFLGDTLELTF